MHFNPLHFTAKIDESYSVVGAPIDESIRSKIACGEYVDFGKLLPKDRVLMKEDGRMELVIKNGKTYWVPASAADVVVINNFSKWEQAFSVFSNIYTNRYPHRSSELIQYNHVIHSISGLYTWDNVYSYDKEFRIHIANHPERSWSVILQQAWTMKLRDRLNPHYSGGSGGQGGHGNSHDNAKGKGQVSTGEPCRRYNKGHCNFGTRYRYDHQCAYAPCGKFGYSILNCRKLAADKEKGTSKPKSNPGRDS